MGAHSLGGLPAPGVTLLGVWGGNATPHGAQPLAQDPGHPSAGQRAAPAQAQNRRRLSTVPRPATPLANSAPHPPIPWGEVRSPRGPKKRSVTEGFACDNPKCAYYGITDLAVQALIAYGGHGKQEWIQDLYCQACRHKFTGRRHTVLYRLKAHSTRVAEALAGRPCQCVRRRDPIIPGRPINVYYFHYAGHTIWDVTARIIINFLQIAGPLLATED